MKAKKLTALFLSVILLTTGLPIADSSFSESIGVSDEAEAATLTLTQLKAKFPNGKYWNHAGNPGSSNSVNNQDGYTSTPCSSHNGTIGTSQQTCNAFVYGGYQYSWQCMGYAEKLGYDSTGYNPRANANGWYTYYSASALDNLKAGDIVRYMNDGHSIFVTAVSGDTVTFTDCNWDNHCKIRWDVTISKSTLRSSFTYVRSAPKALSGSTSGPSYTIDTRYPTPFNCLPISTSNIQAYDAVNGSPDGYIYPSDDCWIQEIYTNGWMKLQCPWTSGGSSYMKTVYCKTTAFFHSSYTSYTPATMTVTQKATSYKKADLADAFGWIDPGDRIVKIAVSSSATQIIYPASDNPTGRRCAWVKTSDLK